MTLTTTATEPFGAWLRGCRVHAGLRQQDLADQTGITNTYLSKIEQGEMYPSLAWARSAATALGVPTEEIYTRLLMETPGAVSVNVHGLGRDDCFTIARLITRAAVARGEHAAAGVTGEPGAGVDEMREHREGSQ